MSLTPRKQVQQILQDLQARSINVQQAAAKLQALNFPIVVQAATCLSVARDFGSGQLSFNDAYALFGV